MQAATKKKPQFDYPDIFGFFWLLSGAFAGFVTPMVIGLCYLQEPDSGSSGIGGAVGFLCLLTIPGGFFGGLLFAAIARKLHVKRHGQSSQSTIVSSNDNGSDKVPFRKITAAGGLDLLLGTIYGGLLAGIVMVLLAKMFGGELMAPFSMLSVPAGFLAGGILGERRAEKKYAKTVLKKRKDSREISFAEFLQIGFWMFVGVSFGYFFPVGLAAIFDLDPVLEREIVGWMQLVLICVCGFMFPKLANRIFSPSPAVAGVEIK